MSLVSETQLPLSLAYPYSGVRVVLLLVSLTLVGRLERDRECVTAPPNAVPVTHAVTRRSVSAHGPDLKSPARSPPRRRCARWRVAVPSVEGAPRQT